MATQLQIKRSTADVVPTITYGELAYSTRTTATGDTGGGYIWVADSANAARVIGGDHFVKMLDHTAGEIIASNAVVLDAASKVKQYKSSTIDIGTVTGSAGSQVGETTTSTITMTQTGSLVIPNSNTSALTITDGTDTHLSIDSSANTVALNSKVKGDIAMNDATSNLTFNTTLNIKDQAGSPKTYLTFGSDTVTVGQNLDIGSNTLSMTGDISAASGTFTEDNATITIKNNTDENANEQADTFIKMTDHKNNELGKIVASHEGTSNDAKGQLKIFTGSTATDASSSSATEAISIASDQKTTFKGNVDIGVNGTAKDLTVWGNLVVEGTTTTIDSTTVTVDDKNIELGSVDTPTDTTADGGGITLKGASDKTIVWDDANNNWTFDTGTGTGGLNLDGTRATDYKIANTSVLNATTLGSNVVNSSLTNVGTLTALTVSGATVLNGGLTMDGTAFTVADTSGNVSTAGTLNVTGLVTLTGGIDAENFDVADGTGNTTIGGTLGVTGTSTLGVINASGLASLDAGIDVDGVFTVADSTGNVATSGTLGVTGVSTLGVINASGLASLDAGIDVDGVFTVADTTGNVVTSGTLGVTGLASFGADITLFDATNNGDPTFSMGKDASDALKITAVYDDVSGNEQKLNSIKFDTASTLGGANDGELQFFVDTFKKFTILDGGAEGHYVETGAGETSYTMPTDSNFTSKKPYLDNFTIDGGTWGSAS